MVKCAITTVIYKSLGPPDHIWYNGLLLFFYWGPGGGASLGASRDPQMPLDLGIIFPVTSIVALKDENVLIGLLF